MLSFLSVSEYCFHVFKFLCFAVFVFVLWILCFNVWGLQFRVLGSSVSCFGVFSFLFWGLQSHVLGSSFHALGSLFPCFGVKIQF